MKPRHVRRLDSWPQVEDPETGAMVDATVQQLRDRWGLHVHVGRDGTPATDGSGRWIVDCDRIDSRHLPNDRPDIEDLDDELPGERVSVPRREQTREPYRGLPGEARKVVLKAIVYEAGPGLATDDLLGKIKADLGADLSEGVPATGATSDEPASPEDAEAILKEARKLVGAAGIDEPPKAIRRVVPVREVLDTDVVERDYLDPAEA